MTNELDIHRGRAERLSTGPELASGQYWRTKDAVPVRTDVYERDATPWFGSADASKGGREMAKRETRRALAGELTLLVKSLKFVDGELHTVELAAHHEDADQSSLRFLVDEFFTHFEFVDDPESIRQAELTALSAQIFGIQQEIIAGPPDLPALSAPTSSPDLTSLVKMAEHAERFEERAGQSLAVAQKRAAWIQERTKAIGGRVETMARYHQERAVAALASVESTILHVEKIQKGLRSLKLYTGEGVEVETIAEGAPAPANEPLTIYQRRLFLDEELAVMLAKGGIDYEAMEDIAHFVKQNPGFIERVAPSPRSVVLLNIRRRALMPEEVTSIADALEAMAKARLDTAAFLLIRNGENIHLVWSDLLWSYEGKRDDFDKNGLVRLFPSRGDLDKPFRGVDGRHINVESLDYTDARSRFDDRGLAYKRLLILLWGLNDRLGLFGDFYDRSKFDAWADSEFQEEHFRFIADDELGLPENRLDVFKWAKHKNRYLRPGSRVFCHWSSLITHSSAPGCYKWHDRSSKYEELARATQRFGVDVVRDRAGELVVTAEVKDYNTRKTRGAFVNLFAHREDNYSIAFLCLDAITISEIDRYIESRRDRENYLSYLWLFIEVRKILIREAAAQSEAREEALAAIAAAQIAERDAAERVVDEAIRLWRADNKGELFPTRAGNRNAFTSVLNTAFVLLGKDVDAALIGEKVAAAIGRTPLRVSVNGDGHLVLYSAPVEAELRPQLGAQFWVHRSVLNRSKPFPHVTKDSFAELLELQPHEVALVDLPSAKDWMKGFAPSRMSYDEMGMLLGQIADGANEAHIFVDGAKDMLFFEACKRRVREASRNRMVERVDYRTPIGIVMQRGSPHVLYIEEDPAFIYARGSAEQCATVERWLRSTYANPQDHVDRLKRVAPLSSAGLITADLFVWKKYLRNDPHTSLARSWVPYDPNKQTWQEAISKLADTRQVPDGKGGKVYALPPLEETLLYLAPGAEAILDTIQERRRNPPAV